MKTLLLIPSVVKTDVEVEVAGDRHPMMDYHALAQALQEGGAQVDMLDYASVERDKSASVRLARKVGGKDLALATLAFRRRKEYDSIFTNGENVGLPLALLLKATMRAPGHVTIGHRLSTRKKQVFF